MERINSQEIMEGARELSFKERLVKAIQEQAPDLFNFTTVDLEERQSQIHVIENGIENSELKEFLERYGVQGVTLELDRNITRQDYGGYEEGNEVNQEKIFVLEVANNFSEENPPEGYAYEGGAARALLLINLGIDTTYTPRDIDVVRLIEDEPHEGADHMVASKFMPDDYSHGHGVRQENDVARYFDTRDLTINEVLATPDKIWVTESCLRDTVRKIIRPTNYERYNFSEEGELGPKMLSKILRFFTESIQRWGDASIKGIEDWEFERYFIKPFWLALQLDKAFEISTEVAEKFASELKKRKQIPENIANAQEAAEYLISLMGDDDFYYRHAPTEQFDTEDEWFDKELQKLPGFRGHGKSRGDK